MSPTTTDRNPDFQRDTRPEMRLTYPAKVTEEATMSRLAALTEELGPWRAAQTLFGGR